MSIIDFHEWTDITDRLATPKLMNFIEDTAYEIITENFMKRVGPDGKEWPAGRCEDISGNLYDTGELFSTIVSKVTESDVTISSDHRFAEIHDEGMEIFSQGVMTFQCGDEWVSTHRVRIPARPFIHLGDSSLGELIFLIDDFMTIQVKGYTTKSGRKVPPHTRQKPP